MRKSHIFSSPVLGTRGLKVDNISKNVKIPTESHYTTREGEVNNETLKVFGEG